MPPDRTADYWFNNLLEGLRPLSKIVYTYKPKFLICMVKLLKYILDVITSHCWVKPHNLEATSRT